MPLLCLAGIILVTMVLVVCLSFSGYLVSDLNFQGTECEMPSESYSDGRPCCNHSSTNPLVQVNNIPAYFAWLGKVSYFSYAYAALVSSAYNSTCRCRAFRDHSKVNELWIACFSNHRTNGGDTAPSAAAAGA